MPLNTDVHQPKLSSTSRMALKDILNSPDPLTNSLTMNLEEGSCPKPSKLLSRSHDELKALKREDTLPVEDEEYTLTACGDISLSNIDFIPGPTGALTPDRKHKRDNKKISVPTDQRSMPLVIRRVLPPTPAKASIRKKEPSFEMMVLNLKQASAEEKLKVAPDLTSGESPSSEIFKKGPQSKQLINTGDAEIAEADSHGVFENRDLVRGNDGEKQCGDENGPSDAGVVMNEKPKQNEFRGKGKHPKRPPMPRWDDDNSVSSRRVGHRLGLFDISVNHLMT